METGRAKLSVNEVITLASMLSFVQLKHLLGRDKGVPHSSWALPCEEPLAGQFLIRGLVTNIVVLGLIELWLLAVPHSHVRGRPQLSDS